jgi:hypothetical protein
MANRPDRNVARLTGVAKAIPITTGVCVETDAIYIGGTGDLVVRFRDDPSTDVTLTGIAAGVWHPMKVVQVMTSSASGILCGYTTSA